MNFAEKIATMFNKKVELPHFKSGDTVSVHVKIKEGEKERIQIFKGNVIKVQGSGTGRSFTVRKMSGQFGVERTWPLGSPAIDKVEVFSRGKVRRSKIFYLRNLKGRAARIESELVVTKSAKSSDEKKAEKLAKKESRVANKEVAKAAKADKKAEKLAKKAAAKAKKAEKAAKFAEGKDPKQAAKTEES